MTPWLTPLTVLLTFALVAPSALALYCYECDSSKHFSCSEFWDPTLLVNDQYYSNCSHIHNANFCVKMTGIFDGKLGTKRFCSSKDWGNYCEYIDRPGDIQEYRSCISSCQTHGCNGSPKNVGSNPFLILTILPVLACLTYSIDCSRLI